MESIPYTNRPLSKRLTVLKKILEEYRDLFKKYQDLPTREEYLVMNIKIYDRFDWEELLDREVKKYNKLLHEDIYEEFDENRICGIWNHTVSDEIEFFKDWLDGKHYRRTTEFEAMRHHLKKSEHALDWHPDLANKPEWLQLKLVDKWEKDCIEKYAMLDHFNSEDVFTFGRSGGWLSIAKYHYWREGWEETDIMAENILHAMERGDGDIYQIISEEISYMSDYIHLNNATKYFRNELNRLKYWFKSYEFVKETVELTKKGFIDCVKERIVEEIRQFAEREGKIWVENSLVLTDEMKDWITWKNSGSWNGIPALARIYKNDTRYGHIITSMNVVVPIQEVTKAMRKIKWHKATDIKPKEFRVGLYTVNYIHKIENDFVIKVGCHIMLKSNFDLILNT